LIQSHEDKVAFSFGIIMLLRSPLSLLGLTVILIGGCTPSSNKAIESLQSKILEDVVSQGGSSLKSVVCPPDQEKAASFTCTGILESGKGFDIAVKSQEGQNYAWEIVSINGLLNMSQIQAAIQSGLATEISAAKIDCGTTTTYKATKPGEQFECQVAGTKPAASDKTSDKASDKKADDAKPTDAKPTNAKPTDAKSTETKSASISGKVVVTIASSGDISWQRITPEGKPSENAPTANTAKDAAKKDTADQAKASAIATPADSAKSTTPVPPADITQTPTAPTSSAEAALDNGKLED
jgi:hypothetical protein